MLFVDLVQSTELIGALGDEAMADLLDELMGGIAGIVDDLEGTVAEVMGDGAVSRPPGHRGSTGPPLEGSRPVRCVAARRGVPQDAQLHRRDRRPASPVRATPWDPT
jgi:class 3 adenylate cyclase